MTDVSIKLRGKDRLLAKLKRAAPGIEKALEDANLKSANEIADMQRRFAPVDTGELRDSIAVTGPGERTPPYSQPGGSTVVPEGAVMITAGDTAVRYAHLVEYGTSQTRAQPFFWPAYRVNKKRAKSRASRALNKEVKKLQGTVNGQ